MLVDITDIYEKNLLNQSTKASPQKLISRSFKHTTPMHKLDTYGKVEKMIELKDENVDLNENISNEKEMVKIVLIEEPVERPSEIIDYFKQGSINYLGTMVYGMEDFVIERFKEEYLFRFKGMVLSLDEEKIYDTNPIYIEKTFVRLPWNKKFYEESTDFKEYNFKQCPFYTQQTSDST